MFFAKLNIVNFIEMIKDERFRRNLGLTKLNNAL